MTKTLLLASVALLVAASAVDAADLPSRLAPPVYVPPPPSFTWTGSYVGINAGYAFDGRDVARLAGTEPQTLAAVALNVVPAAIATRGNGFTGGGQFGYNYQVPTPALGGSGLLLGAEADAAYTGFNANTATVVPAGAISFATTLHSRTDFVGTVRGRIGVTFDRLLIYGTGGFAYGDVHNASSVSVGPTLGFTQQANQIRIGYTYGGGVEYALPTGSFLNVFGASALTIKAEFLHYDLGTNNTLLAPTAAFAALTGTGPFAERIHTQGNLARVGLTGSSKEKVLPVALILHG